MLAAGPLDSHSSGCFARMLAAGPLDSHSSGTVTPKSRCWGEYVSGLSALSTLDIAIMQEPPHPSTSSRLRKIDPKHRYQARAAASIDLITTP